MKILQKCTIVTETVLYVVTVFEKVAVKIQLEISNIHLVTNGRCKCFLNYLKAKRISTFK